MPGAAHFTVDEFILDGDSNPAQDSGPNNIRL